MKNVISMTILMFMTTGVFASSNTKVIFGADDRLELNEYPNQRIQDLAGSVAGMVDNYKLYPSSVGNFSHYDETSFRQGYNTCPGERFADQPVLASCSGFLVGKDILITAGHCVKTESDCAQNKWVFGFTADKENISNEDIYECSEIISRDYTNNRVLGTNDFAIIRLNRKVKGRSPLKFRTKGKVRGGTNVVLIGHPMGLPMKVTDNATVSGTFGKSFMTDLDAYGGNSGSPVLDAQTGLVEGILVRGPLGPKTLGCYSSYVSNKERGVSVYKITRLKELQELYKKKKL